MNNAVDEGIGSASAAVTAYNSRTPGFGKPKEDTRVAPKSTYFRTMGLENTGGGVAGTPAAGIGQIDPNSGTQFNFPQQQDDWNISSLE